MSHAIITDIETIPQAIAELEKRMPEEIKNPVMPQELANPEEPDWDAKAPAYSIPELTKKAAAARADVEGNKDEKKADSLGEKLAKAEGAVAEAKAKRGKWISDNRAKWQGKVAGDRSAWELRCKEARWKFINEAALDARLGHAKLLGVRNGQIDYVFVWEPDKTKIGKIRAWLKSLPIPPGMDGGSRVFRERVLKVYEFMEEAQMVAAYFQLVFDLMDPTGGDEAGSLMSRAPALRPPLVTYYGNTFDLPFLYKRAWILGKPIVPRFRRGRYWDETRMVDLHESWTFGDRQERSGGLDGLASALGYPGAKTGDGMKFGEAYELDPVEGIVYLINDLEMTEFCGVKMGHIRD